MDGFTRTAPVVHIRALGTMHAEADDRNVALGGPRARALLAALIQARGRVLSSETLLHDVWGEDSPGRRSSLRATISRLRATALGEHLRGGRDGYALVPGPHLSVDVWRYADVAEGDAVPLAHALETLEVFRDPSTVDALPYEGAGVSPFLPAARAQVSATVRRAIVRAVDAHRRHPLAIAIAERLLAIDPDDPEVRGLLVAAQESALGHSFSEVSATVERRGALPAAPTRRIGVPSPVAAYLRRPEDESRLATALRLSRLVSLVGASGVGKSRLAIEWARGQASSTQEHVWFCRVDGGRSWMRELSLSVGAAGGTTEDLVKRLAPLRGTIVLDGLDESPDTVDDLITILEQAHGVCVLITARRALGLPGESVRRLAALSPADAKALFALRMGSSPDDREVQSLISALGGLPLGIEMAAARVAQTPPGSVIDVLLTPRDGGASLDTALDTTIALLGDPERDALRELSEFRGPFAEDAAAAVGGTTQDELETLIRWSLVREELLGDLRLFRMPEAIRRHVATGSAPPEGSRSRHTAWFAARALRAFHDLTTTDAREAWQRLDAERADIAAAFENAVMDGDRTSALSIAAGLSWAGVQTGTQQATLGLARRAAAVPGEAPPHIEAQSRLGRGILAYQLGAVPEARVALDEAIMSAARAQIPDLLALAHAFSAYLHTLDADGAEHAMSAILAAHDHVAEASSSTRAMVTLISAQVERAAGDHSRALHHAKTAHELADHAGHGWVSLMSRVVEAKVRLDARDPHASLAAICEVLDEPRVLADPISVLIAASVAAGAAAALGEDAAGARIIGAVDAIGLRYGFNPRANEPADFARYRRRVREGLSSQEWRDAYANGTSLTLAELVEQTSRLR